MVGKFHQNANNPFFCQDGKQLFNMLDLASFFENTTEEVFKHHVNQDKNDFANWLETELNENKLADDLRKTIDIKDMELVLLRAFVKRL